MPRDVFHACRPHSLISKTHHCFPPAQIPGMEAQRMKDALKAAMLVSKAGNAFFQA